MTTAQVLTACAALGAVLTVLGIALDRVEAWRRRRAARRQLPAIRVRDARGGDV